MRILGIDISSLLSKLVYKEVTCVVFMINIQNALTAEHIFDYRKIFGVTETLDCVPRKYIEHFLCQHLIKKFFCRLLKQFCINIFL